MTRVRSLLLWALPIVFLAILFREGFACFFISDDFAWLGLLRRVSGAGDVLRFLFVPEAQGTIRPLSESGFFLAFESLFGLDNLPFRIAVFATMAADILLLAWITRRLTGSRIAGTIAGLVWSANAALMVVMTWSAAYNQALCPFFLLLALAFFIRYTETGKRRWWQLQLGAFVLGFGALEINVVYPAIAAAYALFAAPREGRRRWLLSVAPLFAISVAYFVLHRLAAPFPSTGAYALHFDGRIFGTFARYVKWSLLPNDWERFGHSRRIGRVLLATELAALAALAVSAAKKRISVPWFCVAWFLATLAPVLPLPDHRSDYYLTIPLLGLAMLAGWGFSCAWRPDRRLQIVPMVGICAYLIAMIPIAQSATHWWYLTTVPVRAIVLGADAARQTHPGKTILIDGLDHTLYEHSAGQGAFYAIGADDVFLTPESKGKIRASSDLMDPELAIADPGTTMHALANDQVVVYSIAGDHLRNITEAYERSAPNRLGDRLPARVDAGNPLYSWLLGPTWLHEEGGVRWMPAHATVRLRGPESGGNKLWLEGICPEEELKRAPRRLSVFADGIPLGETQISDPEASFRRLFAMPGRLAGRDSVEIEIRVDPVVRKDGQEYGLVFGKIAIRP